jgi:hypothetical protein
MKCPQCHAEATKFGKFWVCEEHGQLPEARSHGPLRIFLSYGHDDNEELVRRIKGDLEKRGHDVWFDKNEIKAGDDWRRSITEGITNSHKFVSFLSKHSTRDPGVCRDEIAIALGVKGGNIQTILVESEEEVRPPVNIGHIQWLDMHDWKEQRAIGDSGWEQWYQTKLAEIVRVVESDESRRFAGEIETLNGHLDPIKSDARIASLLSKGYYGRQWLFEAVENWRNDTTQVSRLFWIMGAPGVGKSAFAAQLTHTRSDAVFAAQFVEWDKPGHRDARRVIRSIAFQLATRLPSYRTFLLTLPELAELDRKNADELFDYLLANPLKMDIGGGRERKLIIIDALDEAGEAGRNPLVEMLARHAPRLPDWLGLVVTSRPESAVKTPLQGLNPFVLDTRTEANLADLRDYLRQKLALQLHDRPDADCLTGQILEKSEGVFLYVERFCDDVQQNHLSLDHPEQFPQGLGGIFCQYFQRQFPDLEKFRKDVRPALRAILAAREPLPVEILQRLFNWQAEELRDFIRPLASLFPVTNETGQKVIKPYHKSLRDWLGNEANAGDYFLSIAEGDGMLADFCWIAHTRGMDSFGYSPAHLLSHAVTSKKWPLLTKALLDIEFIEGAIKTGFFEELLDANEARKRSQLKNTDSRQSFAASLRLPDSEAIQRSQRYAIPEDLADSLSAPLQRLLSFFALSDSIAINYAGGHYASLRSRIGIGGFVIIVCSIAGYVFVKSSTGWFMASYFVLLGFVYTLYRGTRQNRAYQKKMEFRAHTEALRVQLFWRLAGVNNLDIDAFLGGLESPHAWLIEVVKASRRVMAKNAGAGFSQSGLGDQASIFAILTKCWINEQLRYLVRSAHRREAAECEIRKRTWCGFVISGCLILAIVALGSSRNLMGASLAIAANTSLFYCVLLQCRRFHPREDFAAPDSKLREYYSEAKERIDRLIGSNNIGDARRLIFELGKKVLMEMTRLLPVKRSLQQQGGRLLRDT